MTDQINIALDLGTVVVGNNPIQVEKMRFLAESLESRSAHCRAGQMSKNSNSGALKGLSVIMTL